MTTTTGWHSLYFDSQESKTVADDLYQHLEQAGYYRYDPFAGGTGTPPGLTQFVRLFVAPSESGWVGVLGTPDVALVAGLSHSRNMLHIWLTDADTGIAFYSHGEPDPGGLGPYLRAGNTLDDLERIRVGNFPIAVERPNAAFVPDDIQQLANDHHVNSEQAGKLINRLTSQMFGKLDRSSAGEAGTMQSQAQALVAGVGKANWNSGHAQRLRTMMKLLNVPDNWRDPSFEDVLEAYQVARRLRKSPNARLMPDELAAQRAVPNAIAYIPVYVGK